MTEVEDDGVAAAGYPGGDSQRHCLYCPLRMLAKIRTQTDQLRCYACFLENRATVFDANCCLGWMWRMSKGQLGENHFSTACSRQAQATSEFSERAAVGVNTHSAVASSQIHRVHIAFWSRGQLEGRSR